MNGLLLKSGVTGGALVTQWLLFRNRPAARRSATIGNLAVGGSLAGIAIRNHRIPAPR